MSKEEILQQLHTANLQLVDTCKGIDEELFFRQPKEKWSIAQNVKHLTISANTTRLAYSLPKFIVKIYGGKPNRPSRSYDEVVNKYQLKLQQGGKASGIYIPKIINPATGKTNLLQTFIRSAEKLSAAIQLKNNETQLDQYIIPHPLLGKITLRELAFFTIYHTQHHHQIILQRTNTP